MRLTLFKNAAAWYLGYSSWDSFAKISRTTRIVLHFKPKRTNLYISCCLKLWDYLPDLKDFEDRQASISLLCRYNGLWNETLIFLKTFAFMAACETVNKQIFTKYSSGVRWHITLGYTAYTHCFLAALPNYTYIILLTINIKYIFTTGLWW